MTFKIPSHDESLFERGFRDFDDGMMTEFPGNLVVKQKEEDFSKIILNFELFGKYSLLNSTAELAMTMWENLSKNEEEICIFKDLFFEFSRLFSILKDEIVGEISITSIMKTLEIIYQNLLSFKSKISEFVNFQQISFLKMYIKELKSMLRIFEEQKNIKQERVVIKNPTIFAPDKELSSFKASFEIKKNMKIIEKLDSRSLFIFSPENKVVRAINYSSMLNEARIILNSNGKGASELFEVVRNPASFASYFSTLVKDSMNGAIKANDVSEIGKLIASVFDVFCFALKTSQSGVFNFDSFFTLSTTVSLLSLSKGYFQSLEPFFVFFSNENILHPSDSANEMLVNLYSFTSKLLLNIQVPEEFKEKPESFKSYDEYKLFFGKCLHGQIDEIVTENEELNNFAFQVLALKELNCFLEHKEEKFVSKHRKLQIIKLFADSFIEKTPEVERCIERISQEIPVDLLIGEISNAIEHSEENISVENASLLFTQIDALQERKYSIQTLVSLVSPIMKIPELMHVENVEIQDDYIECFANAFCDLMNGICSKNFVLLGRSVYSMKLANEKRENKFCSMFMKNVFDLEKLLLCSRSDVSIILASIKNTLDEMNILTKNRYEFLVPKINECIGSVDNSLFGVKVDDFLSSIPEFNLFEEDPHSLIEEIRSRFTKEYLNNLLQEALSSMCFKELISLTLALSIAGKETNEAHLAALVVQFIEFSSSLKMLVNSPITLLRIQPMIERNKQIDQPEPNENHDLGFKFMKRKHKKTKMAVVDVELDEIEADYESENARFEEIFGSSADSLRSIISKL